MKNLMKAEPGQVLYEDDTVTVTCADTGYYQVFRNDNKTVLNDPELGFVVTIGDIDET